MTSLDELLRRNLIESVERDDATAAKWLEAHTGESAPRRFDRLHRSRNRSEHGSRTLDKAEVVEAIDTAAQAILATCAKLP